MCIRDSSSKVGRCSEAPGSTKDSPHDLPQFLARGKRSSKSPPYIAIASPIWFSLFRQTIWCAFSFAFPRAGKSMPARMAIMAMTTNNSIRVNACLDVFTACYLSNGFRWILTKNANRGNKIAVKASDAPLISWPIGGDFQDQQQLAGFHRFAFRQNEF